MDDRIKMQTPSRYLSDRYELKPGISKIASSVSHDSLIKTISIACLSIRIENQCQLSNETSPKTYSKTFPKNASLPENFKIRPVYIWDKDCFCDHFLIES